MAGCHIARRFANTAPPHRSIVCHQVYHNKNCVMRLVTHYAARFTAHVFNFEWARAAQLPEWA